MSEPAPWSAENPYRVFVAWDHELRAELAHTLRRVRKTPQRGDQRYEVTALGLDESSAGAVWSDVVQPKIDACHTLVAYLDTPNANVSFEVGHALGLDKHVRMVRGRPELPRWLGEEPYTEQLVFQATGHEDLRKQYELGDEGVPILPGIPPLASFEAGEDTLVLCPRNQQGGAIREYLEDDHGLPDGWRLYSPEGRGFRELPAGLEGVGRVIWIVLPYFKESDERDGQENAAAAAVAGFADARGCEVHPLVSTGVRDLADVGLRTHEWRDEDELGRLLDTLARTDRAAQVTPGDALGTWLAHLELWNRELVPFFSQFASKTFADVYVERLVGDERPREREPRERVDHRFRLRDLLANRQNDSGRPRWAVLGAPGSGKSTLCRRLCAELASERGEVVPVLVSLAHLARTKLSPFQVAEHDLGEAGAGLAKELEERAKDGRNVWLLLDGLDEVRSGDVEALRGTLDAFFEAHPTCPVVLTSRPAGHVDLGLGFERLNLLDLDANDARKLLGGWIPDRAELVWKRIQDRPQLVEVSKNPLLLTLVAKLAIERDGEDMPVDKLGVYRASVKLLLDRGVKAEPRRVKDPIVTEALLPEFCRRLQEDGGESWTEDELSEVLLACCKEAEFQATLGISYAGPAEFLEDLREPAGLLAPTKGPSQPWEFLHRSLKEHLAARAYAAGDLKIVLERARAVATQMNDREDGQNRERGRKALALWAETWSMTAALCTDADATRELLGELRRMDVELARRTLPDVTCLERRAVLEYLHSLEEWDGDDLRRLAEGWVANGVDAKEVLDLLLEDVSKSMPLERAAWILYAAEHAELPVDRVEFFEATGRPVRGDDPAACGIEMIEIPSTGDVLGEEPWLMGAPEDEEDRWDYDHIPHPVRLRSFALGKYPVTLEEWARFEGERSKKRGPKDGVSWWEAWLFCRWVGGHLPTEAQWEWACRAGTRTRFYSGDLEKDLARAGWYGENSKGKAHPVGRKEPSAWGLHDMHGNVDEWCNDYWAGEFVEEQPDDPEGPRSGAGRVIRGGSFWDDAGRCRSAFRGRRRPGGRFGYRGFRVARPPARP